MSFLKPQVSKLLSLEPTAPGAGFASSFARDAAA